MTTRIILLIAIFVVGGLLTLSCNFQAINTSDYAEQKPGRQKAEEVVMQLANHGYYKYTDSSDMDSLKEDLISTIAEYGILSTIYFEKTFTPKDYRYYLFDGETVFEYGGFDNAFKDMKGLFDKIGLKLEISNHIEENDPITNGLNHELTVNGKRYIIFKNFKDYGWGEAAQKFAELINDQLQIQNKNERLYLINGGNDGAAVFLTDKQFEIIDKIVIDDLWKPLKVDKWCKVFKVKPVAND